MSLIDNLAAAIARFEGFYQPGSLAARNNNPGNLRSWGSNPVENGYAKFPTPEAGWAALRRQVELNIGRGLTLQEFFGGKSGVYPGYAPAADRNNPQTYAATVAGWLGIPLNRPLADLQTSATSGPEAPSPQFTPATFGPNWPALDFTGADELTWLPWAALAVGAVSLGLLLFSE